MRKSIIQSLVLAAVAASMAACDDNAWNDKLDGFEVKPITTVKTIEYTLTDADYAQIASNATNVALAGSDLSAELKAVGTQHYFTDQIKASEYVPAFLTSTAFPYFTLDDGSAVKLTYNVWADLPAQIAQYASAWKYTLTTDDYILVWGSDDNFINGFAPSKTAAKYVPQLLADYFDDAVNGECVLVTYQVSDQEPVFGNIGGDTPQNNYTHVTATEVAAGKKYVMVASGNAAYTQAEDKTYGYLYVVEVEEDGKGIALAEDQTTCEFTLAEADGGYYLIDCYGRYLYQTTYNSFNFTADVPETGGIWSVTLADGKAKITNVETQKWVQYDSNYTSYGCYPDERGELPALYVSAPAGKANAPVASVPLTTAIQMWVFNGSSWSTPADLVVLQPADYTALGQTYQNLSNNGPATLLPKFLATKYPFAKADDSKFVLYQYYANSVTSYVCDQYVFDGTDWVKNNGVETETSQFVKNAGKWNYDPSVTITLPAGRSQEPSMTYYQACVDWVYEHVDKPLGSTSITSGIGYVTSYGNNEYYAGTSAYQNDVDLRAAKAKEQYPEGYEGMTDEEIVDAMKWRLAYEVMPGALAKLHADAVPVPGIKVLYTINFVVYDGVNSDHTLVYEVTGPAEFKLVDTTLFNIADMPE